MGDGSGAELGLVGERGTLHAGDEDADDAAGDALRREGAFDDEGNGLRESRDVGCQHEDAGDQVEHGHERNELVGHAGDAADAADDDHPDEGRDDQPEDHTRGAATEQPVLAAGHGLDLGEGLVGLEGIATAQRSEDAEDREGDGQHPPQPCLALFCQSSREVVHRPAGNTPVGVLAAYLTPSVHSVNFVDIDRSPATIIQNVAPGPPMVMATATPAMFPRPTVPETAVASA